MADRPYVLASAACSLDGYLDDATDRRLILSGPDDLERVDEVRAGVDAILVGAATVRADDPRLRVRSDARRRERVDRGEVPDPLRVVLSRAGDLDPAARVFTEGALVYVPSAAVEGARERLGAVAEVVPGGLTDLASVLADLVRRGVRRLLVEGGARVHTAFLAADLVDELHLVLAPFLVGDPAAPRFVGPGTFPQGPGRPLRLVEARPVGGVALLRLVRD